MRFFSRLSHENIMPDVLGKHRANDAYERCSIILLLIFVQWILLLVPKNRHYWYLIFYVQNKMSSITSMSSLIVGWWQHCVLLADVFNLDIKATTIIWLLTNFPFIAKYTKDSQHTKIKPTLIRMRKLELQ